MVTPQSPRNEWLNSSVDPQIFALNVRVLCEDAPYAYLLYEIDAASGRVHPDAQWLWARKKYSHIEAGGWWCSGLDPLDNWQPMLWGCFKPNQPRQTFDPKGQLKPIKYEHPPKTPTRAFFLQVPDRIWSKISQRYSVPITEQDKQHGFWQWVWAKNIPIIIVEGAKKAGCLLTLGYVAIAIPGVTMGVRTKNSSGQKCNPYLIPELQHFATLGREIYISFDRDTKRQTIQNVNREIDKLGQCFNAAKCQVKVISLPGPEKGVDDFVVARERGSGAGEQRSRGAEEQGGRGENTINFYPSSPSGEDGDEDAFSDLPSARNFTFQSNQRDIPSGEEDAFSDLPSARNFTFQSNQRDIPSGGENAFSDLYQAAQAFSFWQTRESWRLTYPVALKLFQRYLGEIPYPESGLVGIKSPKGTGKTQGLIELVSDALDTGSRRVLIITHRIQLGRAICAALGVNYIDETRDSPEGKLFGYGLCIDSLHPRSQAQFNPENWEGAIVIIDECEQVLWHALNSSTCYENRVAILQTFQKLIHNVLTTGGLVVAQDADLSDKSIDYLKAISGIQIEPWIAVNEWKPTKGRDVTFFATSDPAPLFAQMERILSLEVTCCDIDSRAECCPIQRHSSPIMVVEDSQKVKGKWSCTNLEIQLKKRFPVLRILRIDSESVANPNHPAYGCVEKINTIIPNYDIIIASPTIGTGVSINIRGNFVAVFGIFKGAIPVNDALQGLARVRDENVPWFVWTKQFGLGKIGNGSASYRAILKSQQKVIKTNLSLLQDVDFDIDSAYDPIHLRTWAKMGARINAGMWDYRKIIWELLKAEGHQVHLCRENELQQQISFLQTLEIAAHNADDYEQKEELSEQIVKLKEELDQLETEATCLSEEAKVIRQENRMTSAEAVTVVERINKSKYLLLKDKRSKTQLELNAVRKYQLEETYGVTVTPELVLKDEDGWLSKIRLHYYLTHDSEFVKNRDKNHLTGHRERGNGKVCPQDLRFITATVEALKKLGITYFFTPEVEFRGIDSEVIEFSNLVKQYSQDVKDFLGININPNAPPMEVVQYILGVKLGFTLKRIGFERIEERDASLRRKRVRVYQFQFPDDGREAIFSAWYQRDVEAVERVAEAASVRGGSGSDKYIGISGGVSPLSDDPAVSGSGSDNFIGISGGVPQDTVDPAIGGSGSDTYISISGGVPQSSDLPALEAQVQNVENEPLEAMLPTEGQGESEDIAAPTAPETAPEWLKVGSVVRFCSEVEKYVVKAVSSGTQVMVRSLLSGLFTHTYAHRLQLADEGTG
ncbi:plasmid replication protein, CyRepA1 family [Planktothrix sp. FACHB-1355]|uniref:plasmid replication protein, CyRepA1 family n=1 Tax=Planktothrix sp. FACHB-1355 TaxID=2692854 RepID=UPI001F54D1B1|nr:plasmid replication protein, CyRepA1 family [Planktothrix sp. FACHB-1355]